MKLDIKFITNLKTKEATNKVEKAIQQGLKDSVTDIARDAFQLCVVDTGHNRRSIKFEVGPGGEVAKNKLEGAIYSTSGYGGYLETGTMRMENRPYLKPALDMNKHKLPNNIKGHLG